MASKTPQYTIKTGADSSDYFSREVTASDIADGKLYTEDQIGLIQDDTVESGCDIFHYPVLIRRTGDSFKGSTESIESNELRKGRTKSAPRKGNSSAEGSLDFELSPETYDDILEAALRGKWTYWESDTESKTNIAEAGEEKDTFERGTFLSKVMDLSTGEAKITKTHKRLWAKGNEIAAIKAEIARDPNNIGKTLTDADYAKDPRFPVIISDIDLDVAELTCGTNDVKYSVLKHFGGVEGDDLYQEFRHMAVNTMSLSVSPGQIVTGSFGFMGANNPNLVQRGVNKDGMIESYKDKTQPYDASSTTEGIDEPRGLVRELAAWKEQESRFATPKDADAVKTWIDNLPEKGTSTDQYTAREGFLYINGERVRYGSSLEFSLDNGLNKIFAIFEKDAISTSPMTLDVTGTLGVYLIKGYSENLYNLATQDKDVEVLFCFQDKEDDPESLYVVQIFKTKFTDTDLSSGAETLEVSFPFQSFEERACRIFRLRKKTATVNAVMDNDVIKGVKVTLDKAVEVPTALTDFGDKISIKVNGEAADGLALNVADTDSQTLAFDFDDVTLGAEDVTIDVYINYNGQLIRSSTVIEGKTINRVELLASNDKIEIELAAEPKDVPTSANFDDKVSVKVDGTDVTNLTFDNYDTATKVITYTFDEIGNSYDDKNVEVSVTYEGKTVTQTYTLEGVKVKTNGITVNSDGFDIELEPIPTFTPVATDFIVSATSNGNPVTCNEATTFYDSTTSKVTYEFDSSAGLNSGDSVEVSVTLNGTETTATLTIA